MNAVDPIALAAEHWYGYGTWRAPYWFVGPEPGKAKKEGDNLLDRCAAWLDLCGDPRDGALIDCYDHHKRFRRLEFFVRDGRKRVPMQRTWRQLIRLLLAFEGKASDDTSIAGYQATAWGRLNGRTCVAELSALAMNSVSSKQELRERFRSERAAHLRDEIAKNHPEFVVMYGGGEKMRPYWQLIACGSRGVNCLETKAIVGSWSADFAYQNGVVFVVAKHPVMRGAPAPPNEYWTGIAAEIRRLREVT